ncbi:MAG: glycoside hydrolase family 127 protein [Flavobacteriaceae bacterium]|nr:glycoside hydrolase family 127 protein [Flavobacteriaceae bacterium]
MFSIDYISKLTLFIISLILISCSNNKNKANIINDYPITPVSFTNVTIEDNFWKKRLEINKEITIPATLKKSEETGRISNFAKAGKLEEGEFEGIFFNDSDVFKIIEGASYSLHVNPNPKLKKNIDEVIYKIASAQEKDGYLYTNRTINPKKAADSAGIKRWTNLEIFHELYNVGHLYEAAVAHYEATGEKKLLNVAIKNANLINEVFGPNKNYGVPGHQEIEIGLVKLYRVTGEKKYLDLAKFFIDQKGRNKEKRIKVEKTNPWGGTKFDQDFWTGKYAQDHKPFEEQDEAVGHAVRACYFYSGATDIAAITGTKEYDFALKNIWEDIIEKKIFLTGGIGAEPGIEGFGPAYELPNATAYTETCAAIALMFWNHRLFLLNGDIKYIDVFERILYNGFLSSVSFEGDTFLYPNPLESDGKFKFNRGVCGRSEWFDCSCCPVNIVRFLPSLPGYIYATKNDEVYVNLFIGNSSKIKINDDMLLLNQKTNYPWDGKVKFTFNNQNPISTKLNIRVPSWSRGSVMAGSLYTYINDANQKIKLKINNEDQKVNISNGYIKLDKRNWSINDNIEIEFEMSIKKVVSNENVLSNKDKIAFEYGPIVYCAEEIDNPGGVLNIKINNEFSSKFMYDENLFNGIGKIQLMNDNNSKSNKFTLIPYFSWANRDIGEMAVWFNSK